MLFWVVELFVVIFIHSSKTYAIVPTICQPFSLGGVNREAQVSYSIFFILLILLLCILLSKIQKQNIFKEIRRLCQQNTPTME